MMGDTPKFVKFWCKEKNLHNPMTHEQPSCFFIAASIGELRVNSGVLDVGMSQPILHKRNICASVEEVSSNRMLERVKFLLLRGKFRDLAILLHKMPQGAAINRYVSVRNVQVRGFVFPREKPRADTFLFIGLHRIDAGKRSLQAVDGNTAALQVYVCSLKQSNFRCSESMAISCQKYGSVATVALVGYYFKKAMNFVLCKERYCFHRIIITIGGDTCFINVIIKPFETFGTPFA
jgi:hypothetical protein